MDNLLSIAFEAHNQQHNHHRRYEVVIGRDLLGDWILTIRYGRVGTASHVKCYGSTEPEVIRDLIRERLQRRLSAPKRIGCPYRLTNFQAAPSISASDWLPKDLMARLLANS